MTALTLALVAANLLFALRALDVILGSKTSIETREPRDDLPSLSIIVPARNEERQIAGCVRSLLATRHSDFELIVVDDRSDDATRAILEGMAAQEQRLQVLAGRPLPEGWIGKSWALAQGARVARAQWLLFTDADTEHEPLAATSALQYALARRFDALSLLPDQQTITWAEHFVLPTILFVILLGIGSLDVINDPRKRDIAIFNGQYVLVSRRAYDSIGGHAAVRGEIAEDLALARLFKRDGRFRIALAGANRLARTRMYRSFDEIWRGFVKNFAIAARGRTIDAVIGITLLACVSPLSPILLFALLARHAWLGAGALATTAALVVAIVEGGMRRMHFRAGAGATVHLGLAVVLGIFAVSLVQTHYGRGVEWRGRRYGGGFAQRR